MIGWHPVLRAHTISSLWTCRGGLSGLTGGQSSGDYRGLAAGQAGTRPWNLAKIGDLQRFWPQAVEVVPNGGACPVSKGIFLSERHVSARLT